jgi:hypothetical protein
VTNVAALQSQLHLSCKASARRSLAVAIVACDIKSS